MGIADRLAEGQGQWTALRKSVCVLWATVTIAWAWAFVFQTPSANATSGTHVVQSNWDAWFSLTATDGLRLHDATFNGKTVFNSGISIPQVRVLYPDGNVLFDSLGSFYNLSGIVKSNISNGFQVTADFCYGSGCGDYYYVQILTSDRTEHLMHGLRSMALAFPVMGENRPTALRGASISTSRAGVATTSTNGMEAG
jgi:hypothetical protein